MRIKEISAKNYRTLQDIVLKFSSYYCTISGRNNAGKSSVIRLFGHLMAPNRRPWSLEEFSIAHQEDFTQWSASEEQISIKWTITLSLSDDPALITFIETFAEQKFSSKEVDVVVSMEINSNETQTHVRVFNQKLSDRSSREIVNKLRSSSCLFLHNSADKDNSSFYYSGRRRTFYDLNLSEEERKTLRNSAKQVERKTRQLVKGHRDVLSDLLGKLNDKYDVEFTTIDGYSAREMPLRINLKDKKVAVPIDDWGSGTQNRTYILMSLLQAKRIKDHQGSDDRITPIVVIEEPESFLHPSAQSEFGRLLQELAQELGIQIIASTHSPFMLNRVLPSSNILLRRRLHRKQLQQTEVVDTSGENWMEPFSEHLGIVSPEFNHWQPMFSSADSRVLLVEGETDKQYFEYVRTILKEKSGLPEDIEIVPYGGKDTLKNTTLVGFVLKKFDKVFITFDLDGATEVKKSLDRLALKEKQDYFEIGKDMPGKKAIEGLLPERVISIVFGRETNLAMQSTSSNTSERKEAKRKLKNLLLEEFKKGSAYTDAELKGFIQVGKIFMKAFR